MLQALHTAIFEEFLCRGLLLSGFLGLGIYEDWSNKLTSAAFYSSLTFALLHFLNLLGGDPKIVSRQVLFLFTIGIFFSAIRIITNKLKIVLLLHFILNITNLTFSYPSTVGKMNWFLLICMCLFIIVMSLVFLLAFDRKINLESGK